MNASITAQVQNTFGFMDLDVTYLVDALTAAGFTTLENLSDADRVNINRLRLNAEEEFRAAARRQRNGSFQPELMARIARMKK